MLGRDSYRYCHNVANLQMEESDWELGSKLNLVVVGIPVDVGEDVTKMMKTTMVMCFAPWVI